MALKDVLQMDMETLVKPYIRVEHSGDNAIIELLIDSSIQQADEYLNREFATEAAELANIKLACLQAIAYWYENRGDSAKLPPAALEQLAIYRFEPGF